MGDAKSCCSMDDAFGIDVIRARRNLHNGIKVVTGLDVVDLGGGIGAVRIRASRSWSSNTPFVSAAHTCSNP